MKKTFIILTILFLVVNTYGQKELSELIKTNQLTFKYQQDQFKGAGWDKIISEIASHKNTLIGEDHFFNEIPLFISEVISTIDIDNFFCEIDPYSGELISENLRKLPQNELNTFIADYSYAFSFYALKPEFNLLKTLVKKGTNIIGTDQIALTSDGLIANKLKHITQNAKARKIYSEIEVKAKQQYGLFTSQKGSPYMFTDAFEQNLEALQKLQLSKDEEEILSKLKLSKEIYRTQNHHLRIQLMKNTVIKNIASVQNERNLFKYGAIHMNKAESSLGGYDIGNLVSTISDANFDASLHIAILGKSGIQGVPFKGMQPQKIDVSRKGLKHYSSFFEASDATHWSVFDINSIRKAVKSNKIRIDNKMLLNILNGFDYVIVIPNVTPSEFMD